MYSCEKIETNKHDPTALTQHVHVHGLTFQFDKANIIYTETNNFKRQFFEMITTKKRQISVNKKTDVHSLSTCYSNLIPPR